MTFVRAGPHVGTYRYCSLSFQSSKTTVGEGATVHCLNATAPYRVTPHDIRLGHKFGHIGQRNWEQHSAVDIRDIPQQGPNCRMVSPCRQEEIGGAEGNQLVAKSREAAWSSRPVRC